MTASSLFTAGVVAQAAAQSAPGPLFSNDLAGFMKAMAMLAGGIAVILALVVKLFESKFAGDISNQRRDLDGYGARLTRTELAIAGTAAEQNRDHITLAEHTLQIGALNTATGETAAMMRTLLTANTDLHRDITTLIMESSRALTQEVGAVKLEVARLQERDRLATELEQIRNRQRGD